MQSKRTTAANLLCITLKTNGVTVNNYHYCRYPNNINNNKNNNDKHITSIITVQKVGDEEWREQSFNFFNFYINQTNASILNKKRSPTIQHQQS